MPLALLPLVGAAASAIGSGLNTIAQSATNKKSMRFQLDMYNRQRQDALADWQMQNQYNSPEEQMKRLRMAGLNPNLVYGNGADAQMGAPVRQSSSLSPQIKAPEYDLGSSIAQYQNIQLQQAQTDNVKALAQVYNKDLELKEAQKQNYSADTLKKLGENAKIGIDTDTAMLNYKKASQLFQTDVDAAKENLRGQQIQNTVLLNRNDREAAANSQSIKESVERILHSRIQRQHEALKMTNTKIEADKLRSEIQMNKRSLDLLTQQYFQGGIKTQQMYAELGITRKDLEYKTQGIQPNDWFLWRKIQNLLNKVNQASQGVREETSTGRYK